MPEQAEPISGFKQIRIHLAEVFGLALNRIRDAILHPFYLLYEARLSAQAVHWNRPNHIGIIMDGNRRFARSKRMSKVLDGHQRGADKLEDVLAWSEEFDVKVVTVWIFSLDNFNRDASEVDGLMNLFEEKFQELVNHPRIHEHQIRVRSLGEIGALPESVQKAIGEAEAATSHYDRRVLNIGVAYGGREEILTAFRNHLLTEGKKGKSPEQISDDLTVDDIKPHLYTSHVPDPDLIIRTSGEIRLSGFLLWQSVYSEFYFCDTNWPAFRKIDFLRALRDYHNRQRRFGR